MFLQSEKDKWISWLQKLKGPQKITIGPITPQSTPPQSNSPKVPPNPNQPKTPTPTRDSNLTNSSGPNSGGSNSNQASPAARKGTIGNGAPPLQRRPSTSSNPAGTASPGPVTPERPLIGAKGQRQSMALSPGNSGANSLNSSSNEIKPAVDVSRF